MLARDKLFLLICQNLSNLGTYQEIGKGYDETATERNLIRKYFFVFLVLCLTVNERLRKSH